MTYEQAKALKQKLAAAGYTAVIHAKDTVRGFTVEATAFTDPAGDELTALFGRADSAAAARRDRWRDR